MSYQIKTKADLKEKHVNECLCLLNLSNDSIESLQNQLAQSEMYIKAQMNKNVQFICYSAKIHVEALKRKLNATA